MLKLEEEHHPQCPRGWRCPDGEHTVVDGDILTWVRTSDCPLKAGPLVEGYCLSQTAGATQDLNHSLRSEQEAVRQQKDQGQRS